MNYFIQVLSLFFLSSFVVSCADRVGPAVEAGVKTSSVDGDKLATLLYNEETKLRRDGHKTELSWSHKKMGEGSYQVLAEMKVLDAPKLSRLFQWKADKAITNEVSNHWIVRANNDDTKKLVGRAQ